MTILSRVGVALHNEATVPDDPSKEETNGDVCRQTGTELTEGQHTHLSDSGGLNICTTAAISCNGWAETRNQWQSPRGQ